MRESLLEREAVLAAVGDAVAAAREGRGSALLVVGEAGTGKTTVLRAAAQAAGPGFAVASGRGEEMESGVPFGLLDQVLPTRDGDSAAPVLEPSVPYVRALARLRDRSGSPLVVSVDDLHWADDDSLRVLAFLARRLATLPVLLLAAMRPWPAAAAATAMDLAGAGHARMHRIGPLSREASRVLLTARAAHPVAETVEAQTWERCRGNPLLTSHVGTALAAGADPLGGRAGAPAGADDLLVSRFAGLDAPTMEFARRASVMGASFRPEVVVEVAGLSDVGADRAVEALVRSGLVTDDDERLRFVHPLLSSALSDGLPLALRRRLHARTSSALARRGHLGEAAEHALRADLAGDDDAAALLERVGRSALRAGAIEGAVRHLGAAARMRGERTDPDASILLAEALCAAGRAADGAEACRRVLAEAELDLGSRVRALTLLGRALYLAGDPERGARELEEAVRLAEEHDPVNAVRPLADWSVSLWMAAGPARALEAAERARALAAAAPPEMREAAEARWGGLRAECGDPEGIRATLGAGRWLRRGPDAPALPVTELVSPLASIYPFAHGAQYEERFDDCVAALELARARLEEAGAARGAATVNLFLGNHLLRRGRLDEALRTAERAAALSELTPLTVPVSDALRGWVLTWLGRFDEAREAGAAAIAAAPDPWLVRLWTALPRGLARLWTGDPAASEDFLEVEAILRSTGIREPNHTQWAGHGVAAHLLADRRADAERIVAALEPVAAVHPSRWPRFAAALGRARIAEHDGDLTSAVAGYAAALERLGDLDLPLQRAEAQLAAGGAIRRSSGPIAARPWLARAAEAAEAHGARPLADAARSELRLAGGRRRRPHDRDLLTTAELRVARAAAAGRSNAEIAAALHVSTNTVATHLKRVYAKLEVSGRGGLVGLDLDRHGQAGTPVDV